MYTVHVYLHANTYMYMGLVLRDQKRALDPPGSGVIGGCEPVLVLGRDLGKSGKCTLTPSQPSSLHPAF